MLAQDDDPTTADLPVTKLKITDPKEFVSIDCVTRVSPLPNDVSLKTQMQPSSQYAGAHHGAASPRQPAPICHPAN